MRFLFAVDGLGVVNFEEKVEATGMIGGKVDEGGC